MFDVDVDERHHARLVISLALIARMLALLLVYWTARVLIPFDSSHLAANANVANWASSGLRWDTFHFTHIAQYGYAYEYEYAFMPGTPGIMRLTAFIAQSLGVIRWGRTPSSHELSICGFITSIFFDPTWSLYRLTKQNTGSAQFALLTSAVSIMATSPATWLVGGYSEPFYTFFALRGLIFLSQRRYFLASIAFGLATLFRANGMLLSGFIVWSLVVAPFLRGRHVKLLSIIYALMLVGISTSPFVLHQLHGYQQFCVPVVAAHVMSREWCNNQTIPAIYVFVQAHYWNVGLFKYWRVDQIPNFLLASPPLVLLVCSAVTTIRTSIPYLTYRITTSIISGKEGTTKTVGDEDNDDPMLPHALHALIMASILIFASHTQIALRVLPTLPFMHLSVAGLFTHKPGPAKVWWMYWCIIWWATSCVLWGAFLPPA